MATSSNACSMHHQNPTTWEWNLDNSTTLDAPLSYLEDRKKSTAEGKVEHLPCEADNLVIPTDLCELLGPKAVSQCRIGRS
jgi:hypothetical protein